jgi:hypothetical protein
MPEKSLIVHAGTPKTGSSALQDSLGFNRSSLAREGICVPPYFWGMLSHKLVAAYSRNSSKFGKSAAVNPPGRTISYGSVHRQMVLAKHWLSWNSRLGKYSKFVLTAEAFSSLVDLGELETLKTFLRAVPRTRISLIMYLRSPEKYFVSRVLQDAKARGTLRHLNRFDPHRGHLKFLSGWKEIFGGEIILQEYGRDKDPSWDIVNSFSTLALDEFPIAETPSSWRRENPSISPEAAHLVVAFRRRYFPDTPDFARPKALYDFSRSVQRLERESNRKIRARLRPEVRHTILLQSQSSLDLLLKTYGIDLADLGGQVGAGRHDGPDHPFSEELTELDQVFEIDLDFVKFLASQLERS